MNKIQKTYNSTRNFVKKHRVGIAIVATTATCIAINQRALQQHNDFLKEKGLYDEFYAPEEN